MVMMRNIPIIATIIALLAIGTMIRLGFWQLDRLDEKQAILEKYGNASSLEEITYPTLYDSEDLPYYRRSSVNCFEVISWSSVSGKNVRDESGIAHIAQCKTAGAEGPGAEIAVGWSKSPDNPKWQGGLVNGIISQGRVQPIKLTVQQPVEGLEMLKAPDPANIPNNHFLYAIQWFLFAFFAAIIYIFAARKKIRQKKLAESSDPAN